MTAGNGDGLMYAALSAILQDPRGTRVRQGLVALALPVTWLLAALAFIVMAGDFAGLKPGVSTKTDADRVLGAPRLEVVPDLRYDYDPARYQARRISILYSAGSQVIEAIDLYMEGKYYRSHFQKWFELGPPSSITFDSNGNRIESYLPQGISLHFGGPRDTATVAFFRHFKPPAAEAPKASPTERPRGAAEAGETQAPYLGLLIRKHSGQGIRVLEVDPNSPAEKVGMQAGDVILELGETSFYRRQVEPIEFDVLVRMAPAGKPLRLLVERGRNRFELQVRPEQRSERAVAEQRRKIALSSYAQGVKLMDARRHEQAIPYLIKAARYNPRDSSTLELLGHCYFQKRRYAEAVGPYEAAARLVPDSAVLRYFLGACHDQLENKDKAVQYFQQYLASTHQDSQKKRHARERVAVLTREKKPAKPLKPWGQLLEEAVDLVKKETQKP